jgi:hypothetical protein
MGLNAAIQRYTYLCSSNDVHRHAIWIASWGATLGVAAFFLGERVPQLRTDFFSKLPVIGRRYETECSKQ